MATGSNFSSNYQKVKKMSCDNPWFKPHKDHNNRIIKGIFDQIPCGICASCRRDNRNAWEDRINFDKRGKSSAFVTFTYDNNFITLNERGLPTLVRSDFSTFIDRLRHRTSYKLPSALCRKDWTFYGVGEYGDQFGRPH